MMKRKDELMKDEIKTKILLGVKLPVGNEPVRKDVFEKIIDNIVNELLEIKKISIQSIHM
jgi:transcriptional regulator NrdR family protein